jgi:malonyl-CoA/methylmalonyl-CoA synthetase
MEFILLHLANLSLGAVTLPLNPAYTPEEIAYFLNDSGSTILFTDSEGFEKVRQMLAENEKIKVILLGNQGENSLGVLLKKFSGSGVKHLPANPTQPDDVAMICYTSGTTSKPKGAMITHRNLVTNTLALQKVWRWTDRDILLHVLPLFHVHGLCVALHGGLCAGSTIIMHGKFDPVRTWETIKREKCTMFMGVPTIYYRLLSVWDDARPNLASMRVFISGSAPLSVELFEHFHSATGFRILERYGMTEAQMITSNPYDSERRIPGSVGYPLPGVHVRVASESGEDVKPGEIGEILIKGENVFRGYWRMPEKTEESFVGGWFRSGDLGYQDAKDEMRLYLVGRTKELIISGGYNIYPKEVESVLDQHEAVLESAVLGLGDPEFGEKVAAAVVLRQDQPAPTEEDLIAFCRSRLVGYKCPKKIVFVDELPRNAMGKIQKHVIKKILLEGWGQ